MRIVFFGSAAFGIPCLNAINKTGDELVGIFTQPAQRAGRGRKPRPTPVAVWAEENSIPYIEAEDINSPDMVKKISELKGDLLVVIAFGQKISNEVINLHQFKAINVHASLLPKYRGAAPINAAIMNNETKTGISIITLADKMDAGFILDRSEVEITPDDDAQTLHDKLAEAAPDILTKVIGEIFAGWAEYTKQDESEVTYAHKLKKSDGYIDWSLPAEQIRNKIRGLWPWPGAQAYYVSAKSGKCYRVTIARAQVVKPSGGRSGAYGLLDEKLDVICGQDSVKILQIKPAGSKLMDFRAFANGRDTSPGDLFMPIEEILGNDSIKTEN